MTNSPGKEPSKEPGSQLTKDSFWQAHLRLLAGCLVVWLLVSFGCGIVFADALNAFSIGNVPLGFWFAQQGAIYGFLVLIVFYTWRVGKLEQTLLRDLSRADSDATPPESDEGPAP